MCDILFRAKAINRDKGYHKTKYKNGDWVYGLVTRSYDERFENLPAEMTNINGVSGIEVDYKTIGQYTGLTDKNGVKIFEGDIIRYEDDIGYVIYNGDDARFLVDSPNRYISMDYSNEFEVIGNIHDNPKLLKEGEKVW